MSNAAKFTLSEYELTILIKAEVKRGFTVDQAIEGLRNALDQASANEKAFDEATGDLRKAMDEARAELNGVQDLARDSYLQKTTALRAEFRRSMVAADAEFRRATAEPLKKFNEARDDYHAAVREFEDSDEAPGEVSLAEYVCSNSHSLPKPPLREVDDSPSAHHEGEV